MGNVFGMLYPTAVYAGDGITLVEMHRGRPMELVDKLLKELELGFPSSPPSVKIWHQRMNTTQKQPFISNPTFKKIWDIDQVLCETRSVERALCRILNTCLFSPVSWNARQLDAVRISLKKRIAQLYAKRRLFDVRYMTKSGEVRLSMDQDEYLFYDEGGTRVFMMDEDIPEHAKSRPYVVMTDEECAARSKLSQAAALVRQLAGSGAAAAPAGR